MSAAHSRRGAAPAARCIPSSAAWKQFSEALFVLCSAVLYDVLHIFTQAEVQLLYYRMTQVKVESLPFTFYSSESIKVHKMVYTYTQKYKVYFVLFLG